MSFPTQREADCTDEEWGIRVELAACYRAVALFGMTDLIHNHITARVPGKDHHILINAYGLHYEEITASNLLKIDLDGNVITHPANVPYGVNLAGYVIHSAVHAARSDVVCVLHTHTRAGVAVSAMAEGLLPISQTALRFLGRIGYHDFEGPATNLDERARLVENLGRDYALILRHHGLLTCGRSIGETFTLMQRLDTACKIQIDAMAGTVTLPTTQAQQRTATMFAPNANDPGAPPPGTIEWEALLRQLDRKDPSYRT